MDETAALIEALDHVDIAIRQTASEQLFTLGEAALPALLAAVQAQSGRKSWEAARLIAQMDNPACLEPMLEMLTSTHPLLGHVTIDLLLKHDLQPYLTQILKALPHALHMVQLRLVEILAKVNDPRIIPILLELLPQATSASLRYTIIQTLGILGDPQVIPYLLPYYHDPDHHVRKRVQIAMTRLENLSKEFPQ